MPRQRTRRASKSARVRDRSDNDTSLRIVGGRFRGRRLEYSGDRCVRPMKDRVRESLFNLLGPSVKGGFAIDLFAGTGALALEAISRGAVGAVVIERHLPTWRILRANVEQLDVKDIVHLVRADTFHWQRQSPELPPVPWVVFCSPPYRLFQERRDDLLEMLDGLLCRAPAKSLFAVEATDEFDFSTLPSPEQWDIRSYPPAVLALLRLEGEYDGGKNSVR